LPAPGALPADMPEQARQIFAIQWQQGRNRPVNPTPAGQPELVHPPRRAAGSEATTAFEPVT